MAWFKKTKTAGGKRTVKIPEGLWEKCGACKEIIYKKEIEKNLKVCPKCNYHFRLTAAERINYLTDEGSFEEMEAEMTSTDPLAFVDSIAYAERLKNSREKSNGLFFHGRKHGLGGGRENCEGHRTGA
jgi:acetyl-CoA carboxylase carboxyl transferase subunit beta